MAQRGLRSHIRTCPLCGATLYLGTLNNGRIYICRSCGHWFRMRWVRITKSTGKIILELPKSQRTKRPYAIREKAFLRRIAYRNFQNQIFERELDVLVKEVLSPSS